MLRKPISREKLNEFIDMSGEFSKQMEAPLTGNKLKDQSILLRRIELVCNFLKNAEKHGIIKIRKMPAKDFVTLGTRIMLTRVGDKFVPDHPNNGYKPFEPHLSNPQKFFGDAARHVGVMARAIKHEQKRDQVSQRITRPYHGRAGEWQPAKLES